MSGRGCEDGFGGWLDVEDCVVMGGAGQYRSLTNKSNALVVLTTKRVLYCLDESASRNVPDLKAYENPTCNRPLALD